MFSGLVEALGSVKDIISEPPGVRLIVEDPMIAADTNVADSIAVNGCCLTVIETDDSTMTFQCGPETLKLTNLGDLVSGSPVNLERAMAVGGRLGGHFVSGHIDDMAVVDEIIDNGEYADYWFKVTPQLASHMASKGSVAVDGVSLTLCACEKDRFSVMLIPYTLKVTTLGARKVGDKVNIETDLLAKYVQRLMEAKEWDV
jgi:riboflavin synthase